MTAIAALVTEESITFGTDSIVIYGDDLKTDEGPKYYEIADGIYLAGAGYINLVQAAIRFTVQHIDYITERSYSEFSWKLCEFIRSLPADKEDVGKDPNYKILIVTETEAIHIASDGGFTFIENYFAMGAGDTHCMGAFHALYPEVQEGSITSHDAVEAAINAAIEHSPHCGGEAHIVTIKRKGD